MLLLLLLLLHARRPTLSRDPSPDLRRTEDFSKRPHECAVDTKQLLRGDLVSAAAAAAAAAVIMLVIPLVVPLAVSVVSVVSIVGVCASV